VDKRVSMKKIVPFLFIFFCLFCKGDKNPSSSLISILIGLPSQYSPAITSVIPKKGASLQSTSIGTYGPTKVTINGRNFSPVPLENTVRFNGVQALVTYSSLTQIITTVPDGVTTGLLEVTKSGGACTSLDKKSGANCTATEFYIDCYSTYGNIFGSEILLTTGKKEVANFESFSTKAFRVELTPNPHIISVFCKNLVMVRTFDNTCVSTEQQQNGSSFLTNPEITVNGGFTLQFFVSSLKTDCTILVN
jgi:hypothetical protein